MKLWRTIGSFNLWRSLPPPELSFIVTCSTMSTISAKFCTVSAARDSSVRQASGALTESWARAKPTDCC